MKRLVELKEAFTRGQMSEREYLSQSNALISSSTEDLANDAPAKSKIEADCAVLAKIIAEHMSDEKETVPIDWMNEADFEANVGWNNDLLRILTSLSDNAFPDGWDEPTLFPRVCNKALVYQLGVVKQVARLVASTRPHVRVRKAAISFLWIFGELDVHRRQLVAEGACAALVAVCDTGPHILFTNATGIIWGLVEYEEVQELFIERELHTLFYLAIRSTLEGMPYPTPRGHYEMEPTDEEDLVRYLGCLHLISCSEKGANKLRELAPLAVRLAASTSDLMVAYFAVLCLANLIEYGAVGSDIRMVIDGLASIRNFTLNQTYLDLIDCEKKDSYTWRSMKPFTKLLSSKYWELYELGMMALANLLERQANRGIIDEEGDRDLVIAHALFPRVPINSKPEKGVMATNAAILQHLQVNQPPPLSALIALKQLPTCESVIKLNKHK